MLCRFVLPDLKDSQRRRVNGEDHKTDCQNKDEKPKKERAFLHKRAFLLAGQISNIYDRKSQNYAYIKNQNINRRVSCAQDSRISVKKRRDSKSTDQYAQGVGVC